MHGDIAAGANPRVESWLKSGVIVASPALVGDKR
jgi:hypothetical protein